MAGDQRSVSPGLATAVLAACGMVNSLQFTLFVPALSEVSAALGVSVSDGSWLVTVTLLTGVVGTPILSRMADMYGKRRMLIVAIGLLILGSLIAAIGLDFVSVLVGRGLQGFASSIIPIGISLLRDQVPAARANSAVALMSSTLGMGSAVGLLISGPLLQAFGVASLFWFSVIAGTIAIVCVLAFVRESPGRTGGQFDIVGALILAGALTCILLVISKGFSWGWTSTLTVILGIVGVGAIGVWVPQQLRNKNALVDLRVSFRRPVWQTNVASFFVGMGMFGNHLLTVHEAQAPVESAGGLGMSPTLAGLMMVPAAIAMITIAPVAGRLMNRFGGRPLLAIGATIIALAFLFRLFAHGTIIALVVGATTVGIGTALSFAAMPVLIMSYVPREMAAAANGINSLIRTLAGAVATAGFALLLSAHSVDSNGIEFLDRTGLSFAFIAIGLSCVFALILSLMLPAPNVAGGSQPGERRG
ncbi:MFS transporter [Microbacterium sp. NC79]|uniref:MFS transporter n=1 Tax=Microbacterium sp. NC79 TaxID=2851009 RepID=UPI00349F205E